MRLRVEEDGEDTRIENFSHVWDGEEFFDQTQRALTPDLNPMENGFILIKSCSGKHFLVCGWEISRFFIRL